MAKRDGGERPPSFLEIWGTFKYPWAIDPDTRNQVYGLVPNWVYALMIIIGVILVALALAGVIR